LLATPVNVHEHSKTKKPPNIWVETIVDQAAQTITYVFKSDVGPNVRNPTALEKLTTIRGQIADGSFVEKVRSEGGSGLLKLTNLTSQSQRGLLEFDFEGEGAFVSRVTIGLRAS
jgi:hypothetical protein